MFLLEKPEPAAQASGNYTAPSNQSGYQYQPPQYQQPAAPQQPAPQAAPQPAAAVPQQNNSVPIQLGDLSDFEEILSDGEVPF